MFVFNKIFRDVRIDKPGYLYGQPSKSSYAESVINKSMPFKEFDSLPVKIIEAKIFKYKKLLESFDGKRPYFTTWYDKYLGSCIIRG